MSVKDDISVLLKSVDEATNAIAARIQKLSDQLAGGLSAAEAADVSAKLKDEVVKLQALAADPSEPVSVV